MTEPSSTAAIPKESKISFFRVIMLILATAGLLILLWIYGGKPDPFIQKTLNDQGSIEAGNSLFRMNCVGCHGISAQGLVGPELSKVTEELNDY